MKRIPRWTTTFVLAAGLTTLTACESGGDVSYSAISGDLTPELMTINERPVDVDRSIAFYENMMWRSFWSDLGRVFYTDRPNPLSPYELPAMNGQAR